MNKGSAVYRPEDIRAFQSSNALPRQNPGLNFSLFPSMGIGRKNPQWNGI